MSESPIQALRQAFQAAGQAQVFRFYDTNSADWSQEEKDSFIRDLESFDVDEVNALFASTKSAASSAAAEVTPFTNLVDLQAASAEEAAAWRVAGLEAIGRGEAALLLMGGGQGTRLGFAKPKGLYDIGLPSHKSLLQVQAERLLKVRALAAASVGKRSDEVSVPWYIMTSDFTHEETITFFRQRAFFGIPERDVKFFKQGRLPCVDSDGKIILSSRSSVALAPNGNGGVYEACLKSGAVADMKDRGVKYVHAYCVDNALVKVLDPYFIGLAAVTGVECVNKVVRKEEPHERVGCMCMRGDEPGVIEYSEISKEQAEQIDPETGLLAYRAANIANHLFTAEFLERMATTVLPVHVANKKIPHADESGATVKPDAPNGIKMEKFVFDVFPFAKSISAFSVARDGEFTAVKNNPANSNVSTPITARNALSQYHIALATKAGATIVPNPDDPDACFEISPLLSYDGEGLEEIVAGAEFTLPHHLL